MEFIWNDGGRASGGYVGLTGDCVVRSIAIATGVLYRSVYESIGKASKKTPRNGVCLSDAEAYLSTFGWEYVSGSKNRFESSSLPKGVVIVHLAKPNSHQRSHFCTVVDHVIYDTWNPSDEDDYFIHGYWKCSTANYETTTPIVGSFTKRDTEQVITQKEFDRILHRLRSLDNTASNHASTEGEKRNALRMMQSLMLRHNLSREDISDDDNVESVSFTRVACPVNGRRACTWEKSLAAYLTDEIFPMTQWYHGTKGHRTLFWFYGPRTDVSNCISLFKEMLLTIATSAKLQYGGFTRGSGASYAEGYVRGLPQHGSEQKHDTDSIISETALIHARVLAMHSAARNWLRIECGISLVSTRGTGRHHHDPAAENRGKQHGSKHKVARQDPPKRITASQ